MPKLPALNSSANAMPRREFIARTTGAALLLSASQLAVAKAPHADAPLTVGQIMDLFISKVPGGAKQSTVDTLKAGSRDTVVTGIVTTMFATIEVIRKAIALGANFIIAHEPTFYNHQDETAWLENSDVYHYKAQLLKQHQIAVWRNHDYVHTLQPDGVRSGLIAQLGWQSFGSADQPVFNLTPVPSLAGLIEHLKHSLSISQVRYIGNLHQGCKKVLLMPGAPGGQRQIQGIITHQPDVLVCGELSEWETAEYVRDAVAMGKPLALVVLGHIASEEPGSEFMARWLQQNVPGIKTTHIPPGNSLSFI